MLYLVTAGKVSLAGAGSETDLFGFCSTPFLQLLQCMIMVVQQVAGQHLLSGILCQSEVIKLAVDGELREVSHSDHYMTFAAGI